MPKDRWQPRARADLLTSWGIDQGVLFPQYGIMWEYQLADDLEATRLNMAAWNRWAVDIVNEGAGRLIPVGHLTLQGDVAWLRDQLAALSAGGVRLAMFAPVLANGKRLSHPDHDEIWELFLRYDVIPTWHIGSGMMDVLSDYGAWCDNDPESNMKLVPALFQGSAAQIGLTDLAMNGVFERYPDLHLFLAELGVDWWSRLLTRMDRVYSQYTSIHGKIFNPSLSLRPSEYIERNVLLICSGGAASDLDSALVARFPESFAFGGDFPHPEGLSNALENYRRQIGPLDDAIGEGFYGANVKRLLRSI
jgi:predicted TIM-barrel fold metal-dependent hydrolase